jgi:DUF1365 family protein
MWTVTTIAGGSIGMVLIVVIWILPYGSATWTVLRNAISKSRIRERSNKNNKDDNHYFRNSALYAGRVWHTRYHPVRHAFQYPLFVFVVDIIEIENNNNNLPFTEAWFHRMWPLSWIVSFQEADHLRNGEGRRMTKTTATNSTTKIQPFSDRVFQLVAEKTNASFCPNSTSHHLFLVTQARYYGYCFNPVSFYYLQDRSTHQIDAVVAEVSNTPWNEMYCYVLHPDSTDQVQCFDNKNTNTTNNNNHPNPKQPPQPQQPHTVRYIFPKRFHVSPFMEMHYDYDWTFWNISLPNQDNRPILRIMNNLIRQPPQQEQDPSSSSQSPTTSSKESIVDDDSAEEDEEKNHETDPSCCTYTSSSFPSTTDASTSRRHLQFSAKLVAEQCYTMHPYRIAYHMSLFPMQCILIQIYIHYEAFRLFVLKRVPFQPHPQGSETTASRIIAKIMTPFFARPEEKEKGTVLHVKKE